MLIKINGELCSAAPEEGAAGGSSLGNEGEASGGEGSEGESSDGGEAQLNNEGLGDEGDADFAGEFNLDDFLSYDPFEKGSRTAKQEEEPKGDGKEPTEAEKLAAAEAKQGQEKPGGEKAPASKAPAEDPEKALALQQIQTLQAQIQQMQQQMASGQQQAPAGAAPAEDDEKAAYTKADQEVRQTLPPYQFNIPDSVMQNLGSDDPAKIKAGLGEFAQGVAQVTHYNVMMQMAQKNREMEKRLIEQSVNQVRSTTKQEESVATEKQKINNDFYGAFPSLNKPELKMLIQSTAASLVKEMGVTEWNENFRNALGNRVKMLLGQSGQNEGPPPNQEAQQGQQQRKPGQRFNAGSGAGRSNTGKATDELDDIANTLLG